MTKHVEVMELVARLKAAEETFVLATVVRTLSVTAAKAGAKAIIRPDGTIVAGWIGGGCARGAVLKAARDCPSKGTMDVFVEPVLPHPSLIILGVSPVALSLAAQARQLGYHVTLAAPAGDLVDTPDADILIDGYAVGKLTEARRFVVVSTQGKGDEAALQTAVATDAAYHAFVGSRRKMAALREKLIAEGVDASALDRIKAPAGLDIGAITPEEIAMSILAEMTIERRRGQRGAGKA